MVTGLTKFDCGPPLAITAHRAKGFNFGLVAILDKPGDVTVYATHPAHLKYVFASPCCLHADDCRVNALREAICDDMLAYDMEF